MKIAFLTSEYPHPKTGFVAGIGTSIMNLGKGLLKEGHQVTVVIYGQDKDERFEESGIVFYKIKNTKLKGFSRILTQKKIQRLLNSLASQGEIDLVEAADWTGITSRKGLNALWL
jgi:starch synthase